MRRFWFSTAALLMGSAIAHAAVLDISIPAQGAAYNAMVRDAKLRGDGGLDTVLADLKVCATDEPADAIHSADL